MSTSPASTSSASRSNKRSRPSADSEGEYDGPTAKPASRKRKANTSAAVAVPALKKKEDRMERNRQAAQASRDRRKHYTEELEAKVQLLEAQLAQSSSSSSTPQPAPSVESSRLAELEEENASLRRQLAESKAEHGQVQTRLESFEGKLEWLTQIMYSQQQQQQSQQPLISSPTPSLSSFSVSPADLQNPVASPSMLSKSFKPQTLLTPMYPQSASVASTSALPTWTPESAPFGEMSHSLVAREQLFLPRISTITKKSLSQGPCSTKAAMVSTLPTSVLRTKTCLPTSFKNSRCSNLKKTLSISQHLRLRRHQQIRTSVNNPSSRTSSTRSSLPMSAFQKKKLLVLRFPTDRK